MRSTNIFKYAFIVCVITLCIPVIAKATPSLGAQPISSSYSDPYTAYLGHNMPSSATGLDFTVWFGRPSGSLSAADYAADVWLVTNSANGDDFSFGGMDFAPLSPAPSQKIAAYHDKIAGPPVSYFAVNLGNVQSAGWASAPGTFSPGEFYFYSSTITYNGLQPDEWLFALADISGNGSFFDKTGRYKDEFSPKTTSSTVPEPGTMLLFGTGLVGLFGYGRKKAKK